MRRIAEPQKQLAVEIPLVLGIDIVRVEPQRAIVVPLHIPHVGVALDNHRAKRRPCHHPMNTQRVGKNLTS